MSSIQSLSLWGSSGSGDASGAAGAEAPAVGVGLGSGSGWAAGLQAASSRQRASKNGKAFFLIKMLLHGSVSRAGNRGGRQVCPLRLPYLKFGWIKAVRHTGIIRHGRSIGQGPGLGP